jgi:maltose phosphorylase
MENEAYHFFEFATRMDLDNFNRNTREGLHMTSIAAAWMNIVYGFGGVRTDREGIKLAPTIPVDWKKYTFKITYNQCLIDVSVNHQSIKISLIKGRAIQLQVYQKKLTLTQNPIVIERSTKRSV